MAFGGDDHKVFNPNSAGSDTIEARLDSHHVTSDEFEVT
jgi:hypothetical protein|tara:strand:+ start:228 stop:344 length:117 start_codon:yes stop_codon:yes gene_type:complete